MSLDGWMELAVNEGLRLHDYFRYVDDVRNCMQTLLEGWRWCGESFEFSEEWKLEDLESDISDVRRTCIEVAKAMSSLVQYLKFEGEDAEMFSSNELPTLDTSIWWTGEKLMFRFYEKPTVPNRVLQKQTALSEDCIRASLNQEVVRRLLSCSPDLPLCEKRDILSGAIDQK